MKCGADERHRRGLDRAEQLFSQTAKMQTNLLKSTNEMPPLEGGYQREIATPVCGLVRNDRL